MLYLLGMKSIRIFSAILAENGGLKLRSEKWINFSVYYSLWCQLLWTGDLVATSNPADLANMFYWPDVW